MCLPTISKIDTARLLGISVDTLEQLLRMRLLRRHQPDQRWVHVTLESVAAYARLPIELVSEEYRRLAGNETESGRGPDQGSWLPSNTNLPNSISVVGSIVLTANLSQASTVLGVSEATVRSLIRKGCVERTQGNRHVQVTLKSIAAYAQLPLEVVVNELRNVPRRPLCSSIPEVSSEPSLIEIESLSPINL